MIKSKASKMVRVGIKLSVADNERKNVIFPLNEVKENLFSNDSKQAFVFTKVNPSKEGWGDIDIEVEVKPGKTTQISSNYTGGSTTGTSTGGWVGTNYGTTYSSYSNVGIGSTSTSTGTIALGPSMGPQDETNYGYDENYDDVTQ